MSIVAIRLLPPRPTPRRAGDKFQEIALRSPKDMAAFERLADRVLLRLDEDDRQKPH